MRKLLFSTLAVMALFTGTLSAQLTGLKNIPGDYPTLAAAILDLNTQGVGPGGVSFSFNAANETAPAGGYSITATGTAANPIIFTGNGNTIFAAPSPVVGDRADAIFRLIGSDYVTLQGFSMLENSANTVGGAIAVQQMTEFGVALFAASTTDGAQNNTIQGNSIDLTSSANYQNAIGIFSTSSSSSTNGAQAATSTAGTNSNNKYYANLINGVAFGMYFICEPITATITESGTDVGGAVSFSGNQITFGKNTVSDLGWTRFSATTNAGIMFRNGAGYNVRFNQVSAISNLTQANAGVFASGAAPAGVTYTSMVSDNAITLNNGGTTAVTGIDFGYGISTGTLVANGNTITITQASTASTSAAVFGIKANYTSATNSAAFNVVTINQLIIAGANSSITIGISVSGASTTLITSGNTVTVNQGSAGAGTITGALTAIDVNGTSTTNNVLTNTILIDQSTSVATGITNSIIGIRATSTATTLNITTNNAITFRQSVSGAGTFGAGTAVYVSMNATHGAVNITGNNFNTSGSTLRAIGNMDCILGGGSTLTGLLTVKNNTANIDRVATAGNVGFYTQTSTAPNDPADTISVNTITFTNLATSGNVTVINRLGGLLTATKNVCNNTISVSGTNTGTVTAISSAYSGTQRIAGNMITLNTNGSSTMGIALNTNGSTNATILSNTISITSGAVAPTAALGINCTISGPFTITRNTIDINLSGVITSSPNVRGIVVGTGSTNTVANNVINSISAGAAGSTGSPVIDGILISGGTTNNVSRNKIYGLTTAATGSTTLVSGITLSGGTTNTVDNNLIGLLTATAVSSNDAIRGINITSTSTSTTHNVYYNTVRLAASSTGTNFGTSGIFHTVNATATTSALNLRNNLIVNGSTAAGTGLTVAHRRSGTALDNYASTSNNNSFYAGAPSATNLIFNDGTNSDQTLVAYQVRVTPRDAASLSENPAFSSLVGSSPVFLHIPAATASLLESGGGVIASFTTDYDNDARPGPVGSVNGGALAPDIGADEFDGVIISCTGTPTAGTATITPGFRCGPGTFALSAPTASSGPGITYSWQSSAVSGGPYTPVAGGTTQSFTTGVVSTTTYYVLVVTCTTSGFTATTTEVAANIFPAAVAGITPSSGTFCSAGPGLVLTATGGTSYSWSPAAGLSATNVAVVTATPTASSNYTVIVTDANGCTATASTAVTFAPSPTVTATATPPSVCSGGNSQLLATPVIPSAYYVATSIPYAPTVGTGPQAVTGDDAMSAAITIPFTFNFYGTNYTQLFVCSNGFVQLGTSSGTTTVYGAPMPTAANPNTIIAGVWSDLNIVPGQVTTYATGVSPNQVFTISFNNAQFYHSTNPGFVTGTANFQIQLFEGSNIVEVHMGTVAGASTTNSGLKSSGVENTTGSSAVSPSGRSAANWTATSESWRYTPNTTVTYGWTPPTFLSATNIANPMANAVTATTTYTVMVTQPSGCTASGSVTLTAGSALSGSATITPSSTVCEGTDVTFNAFPVGGGSPYTYAWVGPNSFASTQQNPVIIGVTVPASGTYTLTITDACAASVVTTVTLTVIPLPGATVTPTSATYCNPGPVVSLAATGSGTYAWLPAAGLSATTGANVDASPTSTTTYTVTVTGAGGCTSTATTTITSAPAVTGVVATATQSAICVGDTFSLGASPSSGSPILLTENFNTGAPTWTRTNTSTGGTPANAAWIDRPNLYVYAAGTPYQSNDNTQFVQSNSDAQGSGSTTRTTIQSPAFSTVGSTNVTVAFFHFYRDIGDNGDSALVEASLDGITWTIAQLYSTTQGSEAAFAPASVVLPALYNNQSTVYVRFRFKGTWDWYWSLDNVTISGTPVPYTYSWTSAPVGFTSTAQNPSGVGPTASTTYSVTVTNGAGCSGSASVPVTVNALPVVALSGTNEFCAGDSSLLTGTSGGTSQWYLNGSPIAGATNNTYYATAAGVYNMIKTNANGCEDSSATSITVTVNALPSVTASVTDSDVCAGDAVTFNGGGATSYVWTGGVTDNVAFTPVSTDTYTVTGTDGNGCTNSDMITVTVNTLPTVVANSTATAVCDGTPVTLSGSGATSYTWTASVTDNVPFTPTVTDTYTVTGTDGNGCTGTDMITVTVNTLPTVSATATDDTICSGTAVTLSGNGATTYVWTGGVTDNVAFTPVATDTYTVTGTDGNGCTNTTSVEVVVNATPVVTLAITQDTACQTAGNIMLMGETPAGGTWSGPGVIGNTFDPVAAGLGMIGITYMYTDSMNGCSSSAVDSIWVGLCTGVPTVASGNILVYPNPNEGVFTIQLPSVPSAPVTVEITNELGQLVDAFTMTGTTKEVNLGTEEGGVYFVRVIEGATVTVHRIVKQ